MIKLSISGAQGRMGQAVLHLAAQDADVTIVEAIDRKKEVLDSGREIVTTHDGDADVLIDFTTPEAFRLRLAECVKHKTAFLSGTTGLSSKDFAALDKAAKTIPVMHAGNYSLGVTLLCELVAHACRVVGHYDIEIVEMHHNRKVDAPSGTANMLLKSACDALGWDPAKAAVHGRQGHTGPRGQKEIGIHALRGGDMFGDHSVIFAGQGERIELTHKAANRDTFAAGAIKAAKFLFSRKPGRYTVRDVLLEG